MTKDFFSFFKSEGSKLSNLKLWIIPFILLLFVLGFEQYNISNYKVTQEQKVIFQDVEKKNVDQFLNYRVYGIRGFRIFFLPTPISIFFINSVPIPDMNAFADSSEQLNFYKPINTKTVFELRKNWFMDYSGILLLIGTVLCIFYGFQSIKNPEYLRMLSSLISRKKLFWNVFFARALLLFLILLIFMIFSILLILLNGFMIPIDKYLVTFLFMGLGILLLAFSVGIFCGTIKSKVIGILCAVLIFAAFIYFIPTVQNIVTAESANKTTPTYKLEMDKLIIYMDWEKKMRKNEGIRDIGDPPSNNVKKRMLEYKENELKKLQKMEEEQIAQLESNKRIYQLIASFFPTTFYQSVSNEISSRGYNNLVDFCKYALKQKIQFIDLIIEKEYFSNYSKVEQFNAGNANIYEAHSDLPEFFLLGIFFFPLWIAAFAIPSYSRFKKTLCEEPEVETDDMEKPIPIHIQTNNTNCWEDDEEILPSYLFNLLSGEPSHAKGNEQLFAVQLNRRPWDTSAGKQDFIYLCNPQKFPKNDKTANFLNQLMDLTRVIKPKRDQIIEKLSLAPIMDKRIGRLNRDELGRVFLSILEMKSSAFYLFNNVGRKMTIDFALDLIEKMDELYNAGSTVLFINSRMDILYPGKLKKIYFRESNDWIDNVLDMSKAIPDHDGNMAE